MHNTDGGCRCALSGGFAASTMSAALENNQLSIPPPYPLPGRVNDVPYVIVGDGAFGLKEHLMKPYTLQKPRQFGAGVLGIWIWIIAVAFSEKDSISSISE